MWGGDQKTREKKVDSCTNLWSSHQLSIAHRHTKEGCYKSTSFPELGTGSLYRHFFQHRALSLLDSKEVFFRKPTPRPKNHYQPRETSTPKEVYKSYAQSHLDGSTRLPPPAWLVRPRKSPQPKPAPRSPRWPRPHETNPHRAQTE